MPSVIPPRVEDILKQSVKKQEKRTYQIRSWFVSIHSNLVRPGYEPGTSRVGRVSGEALVVKNADPPRVSQSSERERDEVLSVLVVPSAKAISR